MFEKAYVNSLDAVRDFRAALATYVAESKKGATGLEIEIRRACDYIAVDRAQYWKQEIRRGMQALAQARDDLHNARTFKTINDHTPACVDEQKAVQRAEQRLKYAEHKAQVVRKWTMAIQHELNEYIGRMAQFAAVLEADMPKAMAAMDRILAALDTYFTTLAPQPMSESLIDQAEEARSMASPGELLEKPKTADADEQTGADEQSTADEQVVAADKPAGEPVTTATSTEEQP